jgi:F0F1-type ATP synthase assembly protein I
MGMLYDLIFGVFVLTFLATYFGNFLDKRLHTSPWFAISLGLLAIIFGLARLVIKANDLDKKEKKKIDK